MDLVKRIFLFGFVIFLFNITQTYAADDDKSVANGSVVQQLGVQSPASDLWRAVRQRDDGSGNLVGRSQVKGSNSDTLINSGGQEWRAWRESKLIPYSMYAIGGVLLVIALFRLIRGKIKIKSGRSGVKIKRFTGFQRFVHWTVAILFVILGITGVILTLGRYGLLPLVGKETFGSIAYYGKLLHNYLGPVFSVMLVVMLFTFIKGNFFNWTDIKWFAKGGGLVGGHASAGRYNGGEKAWYWIAGLVGLVVIVSGLILNFPQLIPFFGITGEQFQQAQFLHAVGSIGLFVVSFGHIYMGTIAMEGAFEAMQSGECDSNWAKEHHDLWYEDLNKQGLLSAVGIGSGAVAAGAGAASMASTSGLSSSGTMHREVSDHSNSSASVSGNASSSGSSNDANISSSEGKTTSTYSADSGSSKVDTDSTKANQSSASKKEEVKSDSASSSNNSLTKTAANTKPDDLKKIEGIGPKIEGLLHEAGLTTFAKVKVSKREEIKAILNAAGPRYKMHEPKTWPEQADLADKGAWDELKKLQDSLNGGR